MGMSAPPMGSFSNKQQRSTIPQGGGQMASQQGVSSFGGGAPPQPQGNTLPSGNMSINDPRVMEMLHGGTGAAQLFSHGNPFSGGQPQTTPQQAMSRFNGGAFGGGISPQVGNAFGNTSQPQQNSMPSQISPQQGMSTFGGGFNGMNPMMAQLLQRRGMG